MDNQLMKNESLIFTLERQNQQGEALVQVLRQVTEIKEGFEETVVLMNKRFDENEALYEKLSEQLTINYDEQQNIKSVVKKLANKMAHAHEEKQGTSYSGNLFKAWYGVFTSRIHSKLKKRMNVVRYTAIRKVDYQEAMDYLSALDYINFSAKELEPTFKIMQILELEEK